MGRPEVKPILKMGHRQGLTDGLHVGRGLASLRPKDGGHPVLQERTRYGEKDSARYFITKMLTHQCVVF